MHYTVDKAKLQQNRKELADYERRLQSLLASNRDLARNAKTYDQSDGSKVKDRYSNVFSIDGSMALPCQELPNVFRNFLGRPGRLSFSNNKTYSRGARYLASIDPNLEVSQKISVFREDFADALSVLTSSERNEGETHLLRLAVTDYLKNSSVTLLNALIHREKIGQFAMSDPDYALLRSDMQYLARSAVSAYYSLMLSDNLEHNRQIAFLVSSNEIVDTLCSYLGSEYKRGIFEVSFFSRPEASHPLVNLAFMSLCAMRHGADACMVVGIPSGATEIALGVHWIIEKTFRSSPLSILLPISRHSSKKQFYGSHSTDFAAHIDFMAQYISFMRQGSKVVVIDDNSSTGQTIQIAYEIMCRSGANPADVICAVAEADLVRTRFDWSDMRRKSVTNLNAFELAVNILPVSRKIKPKNDMREIREIKILKREYSGKTPDKNNIVDRVFFELQKALVESPTEAVIEGLNESNSILSFRHTQLSNFYIVPIVYNGINYASVEHAYQAQKFAPEVINNLSQPLRHELEKILRMRGMVLATSDLHSIFLDSNTTSGNVKVISNFLQRQGFARSGWDHNKVRLMIELLLRKFSDTILQLYLSDTAGRYLVEGNDWEDVFWGVHQGRGRNVLGQLLMIIRREIRRKSEGEDWNAVLS